jgi:hypothetical protein
MHKLKDRYIERVPQEEQRGKGNCLESAHHQLDTIESAFLRNSAPIASMFSVPDLYAASVVV